MALFKKSTKLQIGITLIALIIAGSFSLSTSAADETKPNSFSERVVLDPGFGYRSIFEPLANRLYKASPVIAYLPTRLPSSDWHYYGLNSRLLKDGYEVYGYKANHAPSAQSSLPSEAASGMDVNQVLFKIKAGNAYTVSNDGILLHKKENWSFYVDKATVGDETEEEQLALAFAGASKWSVPLTGAEGIVKVTGTGTDRTYFAYWTFDRKVGYTFESKTSLADFISVLYSFRPVINLLSIADVVLLPFESQLDMQVGRKEAFEPRENKIVSLSHMPTIIDGSVYLPIKDIVQVIQGQIQYVPKEHAVYLSENGYYNQLKLNLTTGEVYKKDIKTAKIPVHVVDGTTMVPLRFLTDQFGLKLNYLQSSKTISIHYNRWFTNNRVLKKTIKADYPIMVFSTGGPSFRYENSRIGSEGAWSFSQHNPPQGYNGMKYSVYDVGIPLLPGDNEFVYRDALTGRVINSIPITADLSPADIPFRYGGYPTFDGLKLNLMLTSSEGKTWPAGYAETMSYIDLNGKIQSEGFNYSSLRMTYRLANGTESKPESFPVAKDESFSYRFKAVKGSGTYFVTLYNPPGTLVKGDLAAIVTFVVVVK